jgi:hypothetical protein
VKNAKLPAVRFLISFLLPFIITHDKMLATLFSPHSMHQIPNGFKFSVMIFLFSFYACLRKTRYQVFIAFITLFQSYSLLLTLRGRFMKKKRKVFFSLLSEIFIMFSAFFHDSDTILNSLHCYRAR